MEGAQDRSRKFKNLGFGIQTPGLRCFSLPFSTAIPTAFTTTTLHVSSPPTQTTTPAPSQPARLKRPPLARSQRNNPHPTCPPKTLAHIISRPRPSPPPPDRQARQPYSSHGRSVYDCVSEDQIVYFATTPQWLFTETTVRAVGLASLAIGSVGTSRSRPSTASCSMAAGR